MVLAAQALFASFIAPFTEFPRRQKPASFTIDQMMEKLDKLIGSQSGAGSRALQ